MKRIVSVFLSLVMTFTMFSNIASAKVEVLDADAQYEFWAMAPYLTTSIGNEEFRVVKAMELGKLLMYPIPEFGERYYFAIAEAQFSNSGVNGKSKLSELYCYLLLTTDDGFIIIDSNCCWSSYYWDSGVNIENVSDKTATPSVGPKVNYMITPNSKYSTTDWDDYNDYIFLTDDKRMTLISDNNSVRQGGWPVLKNGKLYWGREYQSNGKKYTIDYIDAMHLTELNFSNGTAVYGTAGKTLLSEITEANGYIQYKTLQPDISQIKLYKIPESENLYFRITNYAVLNSAGTVSDYCDDIEILRIDNGMLQTLNTYTFDSGYNYLYNPPVTQLGGVDAEKYNNEGLSIPVVDINKRYLITNTGQVIQVALDSSIYSSWNYALYNGKVAIIRNKNGSSYIYDNGYMQALNYLTVDGRNNICLSEDIILPQVYNPDNGQDGYYYSGSTFYACSSFKTMSLASVKSWWGRFIDNVFDDGRQVVCDWNYVGNYYEMWYTITNPDGTVCAKGPTGHIRDSSKASLDFICIAIGNSKFIAGLKEVNGSINKEFYRASVVKETGGGDVVSSVSLGNKVLTPPENTDTVPVQSIINFGEDNLPIGYNIKDNVVGTNKLDSVVRERINAIRLNDIVIVKSDTTASGTQNSGVSLSAFESYDSAMGETPIRIYTNGQNFCWYASDVSKLNTGTYNRYYNIDDKVIYVTYKIVEAPKSSGVTTVVF